MRTAAIYRINEQGTLQQTSNSLDVAIRGNGYFQVTLPTGDTAYTRDGTFGLSPTGEIVTSDGYTVAPGLTIPPNATSVTISATGLVQATVDGQTTPTTVGNLQLATFPNESGLDAQGDNMFLQSAASGNVCAGQSRITRLRLRDAGLRRRLQRQRGDGDQRPDHRPARL